MTPTEIHELVNGKPPTAEDFEDKVRQRLRMAKSCPEKYKHVIKICKQEVFFINWTKVYGSGYGAEEYAAFLHLYEPAYQRAQG